MLPPASVSRELRGHWRPTRPSPSRARPSPSGACPDLGQAEAGEPFASRTPRRTDTIIPAPPSRARPLAPEVHRRPGKLDPDPLSGRGERQGRHRRRRPGFARRPLPAAVTGGVVEGEGKGRRWCASRRPRGDERGSGRGDLHGRLGASHFLVDLVM
jgi:hypothetical protein